MAINEIREREPIAKAVCSRLTGVYPVVVDRHHVKIDSTMHGLKHAARYFRDFYLFAHGSSP